MGEREIGNPAKPRWPYPEFVTPDMEGPVPSMLLPCGCHVRRPDYEAILCPKHLADLNRPTPPPVSPRDEEQQHG